MKRIFAVLGACTALGAFSLSTSVHAAPVASGDVVASASVIYLFTVTPTDHVSWDDGLLSGIVPVGSNVYQSVGVNGVTYYAIGPNGQQYDHVSWDD